MFSQLVQDVVRAVGSWEGQFWAVREIAGGLNILVSPLHEIEHLGGEGVCEYSHYGWEGLLLDCLWMTLSILLAKQSHSDMQN